MLDIIIIKAIGDPGGNQNHPRQGEAKIFFHPESPGHHLKYDLHQDQELGHPQDTIVLITVKLENAHVEHDLEVVAKVEKTMEEELVK